MLTYTSCFTVTGGGISYGIAHFEPASECRTVFQIVHQSKPKANARPRAIELKERDGPGQAVATRLQNANFQA